MIANLEQNVYLIIAQMHNGEQGIPGKPKANIHMFSIRITVFLAVVQM
jgi:hypothetical protein